MKERIGIVLTAGARKKERLGNEIVEPDPEGKVRSLAALTDLVNGKIQNIGVSGGMVAYDEPLSRFYVDYLRRFATKYNFEPEQIMRIPGGVDTSTDLKRAIEILGEETMENSVIYSGEVHLKRAMPRLSTLGVHAEAAITEEITSKRSRRHPAVVQKIMAEVHQRTRIHELVGRLPILLDQIPIVGRFHLGLKLEEFRARRIRKGE